MNYEAMSDFEVNKAVASIVFDKSSWVTVNSCTDGTFVAKLINYKQEKFDPCNNPADMWPIIVENKIGVQPDPFNDVAWFAYDLDECNLAEDKNPLRASAIVFLKMQEGE